jgi:hypothetical protein
MNLKTTFILAILVAVGAAAWLIWLAVPTRDSGGPTAQFLDNDLKPANLTRVEIVREVVLERSAAGEWSLPGKWPVRADEALDLVTSLTQLHTRYASIPIRDKALKEHGLDPASLTVKVVVNGKEHTLAFGKEKLESDANRFSQPTFLRLDDRKEIVRLAPGLMAALDHLGQPPSLPQEYFQTRRLFPLERVAKDNDPAEKIEQVAATAITIENAEVKKADEKPKDE